ncbi:Na+/H+ antiporter subunit E [uncultured Marinobacter sp.]|uniref:Na+/H+ antiporter subunit E n=1 Tax=uncultured Marinobacter sp. TaxID=187379 RepID=UPI0030DAB0CC|tara:strand:+ start:75 stop:569 length:495 start_codon:yes stop_codon:yes gene_type:complete
MKPLAYWIPRPLFSVFLTVLWLLMLNSVAPGHILLGLALGIAIPFMTRDFWPEQARVSRPLPLLKYFLVLLLDILWSNLIVASRILGPGSRLSPGFFTFPLELDDDFAITILASTISLTPGTVSTHYNAEKRTLLIHALHLEDEAAAIAGIKQRYERPLREIFR